MPDAVVEAFLDALRPEVRDAFAALDVGPDLYAGWDRARAMHGDFGLELDGFARHVARRLDAEARTDALHSLCFDDLLLAYACLQGVPAALRAFDSLYAPAIDQVRHKVGLEDAQEFRQQVDFRIFVSAGDAPPRIAAYRGSGPLKAWVRMVASRLAVDDRRRPVLARDDVDASLLGEAADAELTLLRERYGASFRAAFRETVAALDPTDRALLRMRYLHGSTVTELAKLRGIHRITMSRMLTALRQNVFDSIVHAIGQRDGATPGEVASVLRLVRSRLDVSLSAFDY